VSTSRAKDKRLRISRRTFLQASGAAGITIFAASQLRLNKAGAAPQSPPPPAQEPAGVVSEKFVNTSCLNCPARCAITVRVVNGKAVRITGNPLSKVSEGQICPRGHIGLQVVYDDSRIGTPLKRTNNQKGRTVDHKWTPISWDEALNEVADRLTSVRGKAPEGLAVFSGLNARSDEDLIRRFALAFGTPNMFTTSSLEVEAEKTGRWLADGSYSSVAYDLGLANYVLAFGASIVESERPLARNLRMWGKMRRERPNRGRVVVFDPRYSITAAKADQWVPINPGSDAAMALAIASVIVNEGLYDKAFVSQHTAGFERFRDLLLSVYPPEQVADATGVKADTIKKIAREFAQTRPAIAWAGRGVSGWPNGSLNVYAIYCLNALVGSIDVPGGAIYQEDPQYAPLPELKTDAVASAGIKKMRIGATSSLLPRESEGSLIRFPEAVAEGGPYPVGMAIGFNSNFNMTSSASAKWDEAMTRLPYYVHVSPFISEMALFADIVLPSTTFLEQWGYDHSPAGSGFAELRVKQPAVDTSSPARIMGDILFGIASGLGGSVAEGFRGIGDNAEGFVKLRTAPLLPFEELLKAGVWVGPDYDYGKHLDFKTASKRFEFVSESLKQLDAPLSSVKDPGVPRYVPPQFQGDEKEFPFVLTTYQTVLTFENGSQNYAWAQEVFLPMHGIGWTNLAEMSRTSAETLGIHDGDYVWVESHSGKLRLKARVTEWIRPGSVAIARGQGHYAPGKWQRGLGVNPNDIVAIDFDTRSGQAAIFNTRVKVYRA
jgi:thiosulfate reductase / polysulfide reductase chain A